MTDLTWMDMATALALVLVLEGVSMAAFPGLLRHALQQMDQLPPEALRWGGLLMAVIGIFVLYMLD